VKIHRSRILYDMRNWVHGKEHGFLTPDPLQNRSRPSVS